MLPPSFFSALAGAEARTATAAAPAHRASRFFNAATPDSSQATPPAAAPAARAASQSQPTNDAALIPLHLLSRCVEQAASEHAKMIDRTHSKIL